jgi:hypothetical protein
MSRDDEESMLIEQFRTMSDKDREWVLAMMDICCNDNKLTEEVIIITKHFSFPRE